ncbi:uncharacterized protein LOC127176683 [Labeo rohita]|uniref:uncharacterized protein LOC127176683 n=1 Tax=Labeo rohita TaxID=84645 RepID=UPI0021E2BDC7|nr:uncharacterized protein LOC127176683 [Labeo rohita]
MLVQVKYGEQQKYVKLDSTEGQFDFLQFHLKVIERFCLPPDAKVIYKDATGTEVDAEIFSDLIGQGNVVLKVFTNDETLTDSTRRQMINILVAHMIENHGQLPTKVIREQYALGIVMLFPSLRDPYSKKGYVIQDFTLLFDEETSSRLLQKWDTFFRPNVIKEAKRLTSTAELSQLLLSAERPQGSDLDETRSKLGLIYLFLSIWYICSYICFRYCFDD